MALQSVGSIQAPQLSKSHASSTTLLSCDSSVIALLSGWLHNPSHDTSTRCQQKLCRSYALHSYTISNSSSSRSIKTRLSPNAYKEPNWLLPVYSGYLSSNALNAFSLIHLMISLMLWRVVPIKARVWLPERENDTDTQARTYIVVITTYVQHINEY